MKSEIKKKWLEALASNDFKHGASSIRHGDRFCAMGVLCELHSQETGTQWQGDVYMGQYISAPKLVVTWAGLTDMQHGVIIYANAQYTDDQTNRFDAAIKLIETY